MKLNPKKIIIIGLSITVAITGLLIFLFFREPRLDFSNTKVEQGDTLIFRLSGVWNAPIEAKFGSKPVSFFRHWLNQFAIIGIDAKAKPGKVPFYVKLSSGKELTSELEILRGPIKETKLVVPKKITQQGISAATLISNIISGDKPALDSIFEIFTPKIEFDKSFTMPLNKWIDVGSFGTLRQSANGSVRHFGVDLDAKLGDPVFSVNDGVVRFAEELPDYGKTIIIDHGLGIFSGYLHLSEIKTTVNSKVKRGEIIGLVGSTGYSIAPHLHFTVKIGGASIDPRKFLDTVNNFIK